MCDNLPQPAFYVEYSGPENTFSVSVQIYLDYKVNFVLIICLCGFNVFSCSPNRHNNQMMILGS